MAVRCLALVTVIVNGRVVMAEKMTGIITTLDPALIADIHPRMIVDRLMTIGHRTLNE